MRWIPQILEAVWTMWLSYTTMALGGRGLTREVKGRTQEGGTVWIRPFTRRWEGVDLAFSVSFSTAS